MDHQGCGSQFPLETRASSGRRARIYKTCAMVVLSMALKDRRGLWSLGDAANTQSDSTTSI